MPLEDHVCSRIIVTLGGCYHLYNLEAMSFIERRLEIVWRLCRRICEGRWVIRLALLGRKGFGEGLDWVRVAYNCALQFS